MVCKNDPLLCTDNQKKNIGDSTNLDNSVKVTRRGWCLPIHTTRSQLGIELFFGKER